MPNEVTRTQRGLRAVRRFAERDLPDDVIEDMLAVARWTGTSKNTQPWHLVIVRDRVTRLALSRLGLQPSYTAHLAGANLVIALVMDEAASALDCGRLAERLMLAAWSYGVGSCIGSLWPDEHERAAKELLGVPRDRWMHQTISFGYPADAQATRITPRGQRPIPGIGRRPLSELVSWERFGQSR